MFGKRLNTELLIFDESADLKTEFFVVFFFLRVLYHS